MTTKLQSYTPLTNPERKQNRQSRLWLSLYLAHLLLHSRQANALAKSKELNYLPTQIGMLRIPYALLAPLNQKRKPQAYGILLLFILLYLNSFSQLNSGEAERIRQQNYQVMKMQGYTPPPTNEQINEDWNKRILNPQNYAQPKVSEYEKISIELVKDADKSETSIRKDFGYYKTTEFKNKEQSFINAATNINQMLSGTKPLSIKDAYYQMENAFGDTYLSYNEYNNSIKQSADFIKKWLMQNGYNLNNNEDLHKGIQHFMKDTLVINEKNPDNKKPSGSKKHIPFKYDYVDFKAQTDHRNFFITKCLATGFGQCNNLPGVYLVLAEAIGAKTYLSFAPQHSFIKYPDNKGYMHNYEPTSNYVIDDKWYQDYMHISKEAKANGIYLDTLNKKMIVASCLNDLSFAYMRKLGVADGKFAGNCIKQSINYFPKGNNIYAYFLKSEILSRMLDNIMYANKIQSINNVNQVPEAQQVYQQLVENEKTIRALGYQNIPEQQYLQMMDMHDAKAEKQQKDNISGKQKRNLFITN